MRRRNQPKVVTVEDMPAHLREFDQVAWGWSGHGSVRLFFTDIADARWQREKASYKRA